MSVSADSPSCLCGLVEKQFYRKLKTSPLMALHHLQKIRSKKSCEKPRGYLYLTNRLKHDLTFQCILCDFKSAMIF